MNFPIKTFLTIILYFNHSYQSKSLVYKRGFYCKKESNTSVLQNSEKKIKCKTFDF